MSTTLIIYDFYIVQQQTKKDFKLPIQNNQNRFASEPVHEPEWTKINKRRVSFEKLVYDLGLEGNTLLNNFT